MTMPTIKSESNELARINHRQNALSSFRFLNALRLHHGARKAIENPHEAMLREYQARRVAR